MEDSRLLGPILKEWFAQNEWPQSVSEGLARSKGWELGPWASQISICMSGRLTPKPNFFVGLGQFNQAVAERDFAGVTDRRLMDRLKAGQPIVHDDCCKGWRCEAGVPWAAMDFFGCYIGAISPPKFVEPQRVITQEEVDIFVAKIRSGWRELVLVAMDVKGPPAVWAKVAERCVNHGAAPEDIEWSQELLSGLREMTIEEKQRFAVKYPTCPLLQAITEETAARGGSTDRLKQFYEWHVGLSKADLPMETMRYG